MRLIHVRRFAGGLLFIKETLPAGVHAHSIINPIGFWAHAIFGFCACIHFLSGSYTLFNKLGPRSVLGSSEDPMKIKITYQPSENLVKNKYAYLNERPDHRFAFQRPSVFCSGDHT